LRSLALIPFLGCWTQLDLHLTTLLMQQQSITLPAGGSTRTDPKFKVTADDRLLATTASVDRRLLLITWTNRLAAVLEAELSKERTRGAERCAQRACGCWLGSYTQRGALC